MPLFSLGSSSENKIRHAISSEPLGPYNSELFDLSVLTFEPRKMAIVCDVLEKKLRKFLESPHKHVTLSRSKTVSYGHKTTPLTRANTFSTSRNGQERNSQIVVLKCLTVIVYLCQWGSGSFMNWLRTKYTAIVQPLATLAFLPNYAQAIYGKVDAVVRYCEDDDALRVSRDSLDQMRLELRRPAGTSSSLDGPPLQLVDVSPRMF